MLDRLLGDYDVSATTALHWGLVDEVIGTP